MSESGRYLLRPNMALEERCIIISAETGLGLCIPNSLDDS